MLEAQGLTKRYGDVTAIAGVAFSVGAGEVVGLLGPNGAGKTTTMRILTGALPASEGSARVAGLDVAEDPMGVRRAIGYLPEQPPLYPDLTVREYLRFIATLKGLRGRERDRDVERVIASTALQDVTDRLCRALSRGYRQRTGLAQALLGSPEVLILDEPTAGLDPRQIDEVRALIRELARERTVLLSTHILQEVVATCERVIILRKGEVVADDNLDALVDAVGATSLEGAFLQLTEV